MSSPKQQKQMSKTTKRKEKKMKAWALIHSDTNNITFSGFNNELGHSLLSVTKEKCCLKARQKQILKQIKTKIVPVTITYHV